MADRWIPASFSDFSFMDKALRVGIDIDGDEIYAGRAYHEGDLLPAKVIPNKSACYVAYNGVEIFKEDFEVFVPPVASWEYASYGSVPPDAVVAGFTADGETLYYGRVSCEGCLTPGKIHPTHGTCYYPFAGEERSCAEYECLVFK